jgi:hypothetical protein
MNEQQPRRNNTCLDAGQLIAWHDGALPPREADEVSAHLAGCARCTAEERALTRDRHQVFDLLSRLDPPPGANAETAVALARFQGSFADTPSSDHQNAETAVALARFQERLTVQNPDSFLPHNGHRHPEAFPPSGSERNDAMFTAVHLSPHSHRPRVLVPTLVAVLVIVAALLILLDYSGYLPARLGSPFSNGTSTSTPTPRPTATPSPSPAPGPYPDVAGNYNGTIDDTTDNITTNMALSIQQQPGQGNISGHFTVHQPLSGSGPFTGTVNTSTLIQFTVTGNNHSPLYFWGQVQSNGDLNGNYCSLNRQNQCDPNAGTSGTWNAAPATGYPN